MAQLSFTGKPTANQLLGELQAKGSFLEIAAPRSLRLRQWADGGDATSTTADSCSCPQCYIVAGGCGRNDNDNVAKIPAFAGMVRL